MLEAFLISLGVVAALIVGFVIGAMALLYGLFDGLTNIDGPPKLGRYGEWKIRRVNKKYEKSKRKA